MIKVSTGINGLDEMLEGGFPKGRIILLCGGPGTGKTVFSLQFLALAAEKGKPGIYATLEEPMNLIRENTEAFHWNLNEKEKNNRLKLMDFTAPYKDSSDVKHKQDEEQALPIINEITKTVETIKAENVAIDPITTIAIQEQRANLKRQRISELFNMLRSIGCTSIFTSEMTPSSGEFYMEEFLADGVIRLEKTFQNYDLIKIIRIEKMRGVKYDEQPRRYIIDEKGFTVYNTEPVKVSTI